MARLLIVLLLAALSAAGCRKADPSAPATVVSNAPAGSSSVAVTNDVDDLPYATDLTDGEGFSQ